MSKLSNKREITIGIEPYFKFRIAKCGLSQVVFCIRILALSLYVRFLYGAGWSISPVMEKWYCGLWIHLGRIVIIPKIGFDQKVLIFLEIEQLERKLWPEKCPIN